MSHNVRFQAVAQGGELKPSLALFLSCRDKVQSVENRRAEFQRWESSRPTNHTPAGLGNTPVATSHKSFVLVMGAILQSFKTILILSKLCTKKILMSFKNFA